MKKIFYLIAITALLSNCGIKGPPLPPLEEETIQSQKSWENIEKTTQPVPVVPPVKKVQPKKKPKTNEN